MKTLKVLTYNVLSGFYLDLRAKSLKDIILQQRADLVFLQEATPQFLNIFLSNQTSSDVPKYELYYSSSLAHKERGTALTTEEETYLEECGGLAILGKRGKFDVLDRKLTHRGPDLDCGIIRVKLVERDQQNGSYLKPFLLYAVHFTGGTYKKPVEVLERKRQFRISEYKALADELQSNFVECKSDSASFALIAGDFNSDVEHVSEYPETANSPEKIFPYKSDEAVYFEDVWLMANGTKAGYTESTSKNLMRAFMKPEQKKEVRFDRILLGQRKDEGNMNMIVSAEAKIIGDQQIGSTFDFRDNKLPLFPSDHFGVVATLSMNSL